MSGLVALRDAAIAGIKAQIPALASVDKVRGKITEQGLQRISIRPPGALIGTLGIRAMRAVDTAVYKADVMMIGFLLTEGKERVDQGTDLMEQIALAIAGSTWGLPHTKLPTEFDSSVLYDDRATSEKEKKFDFAENGMFLQGFSWVQETRLERVQPVTGAGRADDRKQADALGQRTDGSVWPETIETVVDHPKGFR
ncbi:hypothetical protein [Methylobacterium hispanicum]|uniref:hypothetical protein n=1 Tax=Methylobacterium hispanicum TaxID=270350 RepID=UPI002F3385D1